MAVTQQVSHREHGLRLPIVGFVLSILFTVAALWVTFHSHLGTTGVITAILCLAVAQIAIQLFLFMHVLESDDLPWHVLLLGLGLILVVTIVAGSIWIMTFRTEAY